MGKVLMMKSCNVIKYFKMSKSTLTHILCKYNSCLLKNAQTFPLRGKKKSVKLLQGIRNCCPLIEGAWQRDISMNNAGTIIKTPKNSHSFFYNHLPHHHHAEQGERAFGWIMMASARIIRLCMATPPQR